MGCTFVAVILLLTIWIGLALYRDPNDVLRAYPSPERLNSVRIVLLDPWQHIRELPCGDFDGDGVLDQFVVRSYHMEPLFATSTSALVEVRSGRTQEVLACKSVPAVLVRVSWCADRDGNGTEEVVFDYGDGRCVMSYH
jgi:hypothetical protein